MQTKYNKEGEETGNKKIMKITPKKRKKENAN